ncbi:MAG: ATP-dependent RecD-like DNA helicase [Ruminococcaceae bacterium]|nr:ATP-dependent RecD-like DNA helicase [Oscillospiraceae bacterium]
MGARQFEEITGEIAHIIYQNEENGYKVLEMETEDDLVVAVGYLQGVAEGETVCLKGRWVNHATYGEQFKVELYEKKMPTSEHAILKYLGSGIIKGVRESTAKKLVDEFGPDTLQVIEHEPLRLTKIKGISQDRALKMQQSYIEQLGASTLVMFLQQYDVSVKMAAKIYKRFGAGAVELIKANPYILCDEIDGIGFKTADAIAMRLGLELEADARIRAGALYTQRFHTQFGHTFLPRTELVHAAATMLEVPPSFVEQAIGDLLIERTLINETGEDGEERIYYFSHYYAEQMVAKQLTQINQLTFEINRADIDREINAIEAHEGICLAALQREAVERAMECGVLVITGGPGTGKTTIINTIISLMHANGFTVTLTAPTGRAAKRMSQVCNMEAKTIHRLLEAGYTDGEGDLTFQVNEECPIDTDVMIVDEMSMVDIVLMSSLLRAIRRGTRLILVGDVNQLPSVGPGNVLKDIIDSGTVEVIRLTEIFRQAEKSMIVVNAHRINGGDYPICNQKEGDFFFVNHPDAISGVEDILSLCKTRLPIAYGFSPADIQVLSPTKKGLAGVLNLNTRLQETLNPPAPDKKEHTFGTVVFREGDRVMQTRNNYDIAWKSLTEHEKGTGVFNGDVGVIQNINENFKTMTVVYDDRVVTYEFRDLEELDLAYAVTVHKSQGSEFPAVIIPVYDAPYMLVNRNLFYTAVTRAKSLVVLVGREEVVRRMVDNNKEAKRYSGLCDKLRKQGGIFGDLPF